MYNLKCKPLFRYELNYEGSIDFALSYIFIASIDYCNFERATPNIKLNYQPLLTYESTS